MAIRQPMPPAVFDERRALARGAPTMRSRSDTRSRTLYRIGRASLDKTVGKIRERDCSAATRRSSRHEKAHRQAPRPAL
jgi:hypothetical protein